MVCRSGQIANRLRIDFPMPLRREQRLLAFLKTGDQLLLFFNIVGDEIVRVPRC